MRQTLIAATLVASAALPLQAQETNYPLNLTNCGVEVSFDAAPDSAVTIGQSATEILYSLGLATKVSGTSVWFNPVLPEFTEVNEGIERIADNDPSFESVVAKKPGLVAVQYEWHVGESGIVGTREMFHDIGIPTYIMPADCDTKDNSTGGDGTRTGAFETASVYKGIRELSAIFDVQGAGETLVAELEAVEANAVARAEGLDLPDDLSAVFWFSSADLEIDPYVAGRLGAPGYMMSALGIENVIDSDEEWPTVGWETIARADPDIMVIAYMDRRRFPADDVEKKLEFLRNDPVASQMTAVQEGRIVQIDAHAMSATMRSIYGLETLSEALSEMSFE
ncbi:ABC transporter substrate-binding protein [Roseovarius atlanticus]|uniref:ABC transporter substrate-binding protein n=1 Tax=Roseovarius atlanticus TaxID=1641875 RepID=UPI001C961ACF|nr:ABC transporter substrate-binding protein [Roseovarius atlanticus]MBY5987782.1 ABC transporter substrate-binding protein [Roseovarius atlanticus]MBY6123173.1 ABC transporter substrate-binding protein [Roseovarius atlanticus]MBY6147669.1 ABC transporter substrate-binding protein [Roseovarius atlanticus]